MDPIVALLAKQSASRLRDMRTEVRDQIESLRFQAELIDRALADKIPPGERQRVAKPSTDNGRGSRRAIFREILGTRPDHAWKPAEIGAALTERNIQASSAAVRVMLRRMAADREVTHGADGAGWKLVSANGSPGEVEPNAATTENETTEPPSTATESQDGQ